MEALYFSGITMTTVGFGDYSPATVGGKLIACLHILVSITMVATCTHSGHLYHLINFATDSKLSPLGRPWRTYAFGCDLAYAQHQTLSASHEPCHEIYRHTLVHQCIKILSDGYRAHRTMEVRQQALSFNCRHSPFPLYCIRVVHVLRANKAQRFARYVHWL